MNSYYGQLNFGLDIDLDIKAQEKTKSNGTERLHKFKVKKHLNI